MHPNAKRYLTPFFLLALAGCAAPKPRPPVQYQSEPWTFAKVAGAQARRPSTTKSTRRCGTRPCATALPGFVEAAFENYAAARAARENPPGADEGLPVRRARRSGKPSPGGSPARAQGLPPGAQRRVLRARRLGHRVRRPRDHVPALRPRGVSPVPVPLCQPQHPGVAERRAGRGAARDNAGAHRRSSSSIRGTTRPGEIDLAEPRWRATASIRCPGCSDRRRPDHRRQQPRRWRRITPSSGP